ncbi:MAG: orotidine-5'-phosphate decarboxylase [Planctomycetaceae bacterium]|nr:orotidine-5'-phosphate decarboxylase [Planctomycetaceae bacterium]
MSFSDRLAAAVRRTRAPILAGLDPRWEQLPEPLRAGVDPADRTAVAQVYAAFCRGVIDAVQGLVPGVKPQAAFFEQLGPAGMTALAEVLDYAHRAGLMVVLDGKRNDIGSTAEAYADAYLGAPGLSPWGADALTVSPYLGDDSLAPFVETAQARDAGIFVLVKTSNPGGGRFQDLIADGAPLYRHVAQLVEQYAAASRAACGYGAIGAVVGATYSAQLAELRGAMPTSWLLVPGYGAQGGGARDVAGAFDSQGLGAVINNSRGLIFAHARAPYAERFGARGWQDAVAAATRDMIAELQAESTAGRL